MFLTGDFNKWNKFDTPFKKLDFGKWELKLKPGSNGECAVPHKSIIKLVMRTGSGELIERYFFFKS